MKTFANTNWTKRNYDCTNIVACVADKAPGANWVECSEDRLHGLQLIEIRGTVKLYGYL